MIPFEHAVDRLAQLRATFLVNAAGVGPRVAKAVLECLFAGT